MKKAWEKRFDEKLNQWIKETLESGYETAFWKKGKFQKTNGLVNGDPKDELWCRVKQFISQELKIQQEKMGKALRIPEWHKLSKESREKLLVMTSYGAYEELKKTTNQKIDNYLERRK